MSIAIINPKQTKSWKKLEDHFEQVKDIKIQDLFAKDPKRANSFQLNWDSFFVDISKHRVTNETMLLLEEFAKEMKLFDAINQQFSGAIINQTESRAVLHTALRDFSSMKPEVASCLLKMKSFSDGILSGAYKGFTGKPIETIVNVGIGGSDLGPKMVYEALSSYRKHTKAIFISNIDGDSLENTLDQLNPETTLFVVVSKSFSTQETLTNAKTIKSWFLENAPETAIKNHFAAISTNIKAVESFGIEESNIFPMWDWVGGRFSLWSSVGLSLCCTIGFENFENLLQGAHKMDIHFKTTPTQNNVPVVLALLSVWYSNFFNVETEAVVPYADALHQFVPYLQQAVMESNGKCRDRSGNEVNYQTSSIIWGNVGTNAQHAFFQLLHQGTKLIPVDFIGFSKPTGKLKNHHEILLANMFAQSEALCQGTYNQNPEDPFKSFEGNKPSTTLLIDRLTPESLGSLIALYEHKIFVQGVLWNINSYDQWGVELGKTIAQKTLLAIKNKDLSSIHPSTKELLSKL